MIQYNNIYNEVIDKIDQVLVESHDCFSEEELVRLQSAKNILQGKDDATAENTISEVELFQLARAIQLIMEVLMS